MCVVLVCVRVCVCVFDSEFVSENVRTYSVSCLCACLCVGCVCYVAFVNHQGLIAGIHHMLCRQNAFPQCNNSVLTPGTSTFPDFTHTHTQNTVTHTHTFRPLEQIISRSLSLLSPFHTIIDVPYVFTFFAFFSSLQTLPCWPCWHDRVSVSALLTH